MSPKKTKDSNPKPSWYCKITNVTKGQDVKFSWPKERTKLPDEDMISTLINGASMIESGWKKNHEYTVEYGAD